MDGYDRAVGRERIGRDETTQKRVDEGMSLRRAMSDGLERWCLDQDDATAQEMSTCKDDVVVAEGRWNDRTDRYDPGLYDDVVRALCSQEVRNDRIGEEGGEKWDDSRDKTAGEGTCEMRSLQSDDDDDVLESVAE